MTDRAALTAVLTSGRTGLLVIDLQNGFCSPKGARAQAYGADAVADVAAILPACGALIDAFHEYGLPVWFTRQIYLPDDVTTRNRAIAPHYQRRGVRLDLCHRGSWDAELEDSIRDRVRSTDFVIDKHRSSCFFQTPLEGELRMTGVENLVIIGTTTSFCVDSTIRDAYARDFTVIVPRDAVADPEPWAQEATLRTVDRFHGVVVGSADLLAAFPDGPP